MSLDGQAESGGPRGFLKVKSLNGRGWFGDRAPETRRNFARHDM